MLLYLLEVCLIVGIAYGLQRVLRKRIALNNIPGPPSSSLWTGNLSQVFGMDAWSFHEHLEKTYGAVSTITGLLGEKQLFVFDPKAMHQILVKEQDNYEETPFFLEVNRVIFGDGLFATTGNHHRKQRKMLNAVLSPSHLKQMIPLFHRISLQLRTAIAARLQNGPKEIEMLEWLARTALELIGQSGLGYTFDPLVDDECSHPYSRAVKELLPTLYSIRFAPILLPYLVRIGSSKFQRVIVDLLPWKKLQRLRDMASLIEKTSADILESHKQAIRAGEDAILKQVGEGRDMITHILRANMDAAPEDQLPEPEILGQMSNLIFAAMDTTSASLARVLQLLAHNPDIQCKLRDEILTAQKDPNTGLSYDQLLSLPLLDAVCRETLRVYAPVTVLSRMTRKDTVLPLSKPITGLNGERITEIPVPKNTEVNIGILASNRNPSLWGPDAFEWKPERWLNPLPDSVKEARIPGVFSNLMTFIGGGRACIGFQFSQLEMKVVLSTLIAIFIFSPSDKDVVWEQSTLAVPRVRGESRPQMPLKVSLLAR